MSTLTESISAWAEEVKEYVEIRADLLKLEAGEKLSLLVSNMAAALVIAVLFLCFIAFAGVGVALLLGNWIGSLWAGFLIVAGVYVLKAILIWRFRERWIRIPVMNHFLKIFFHDDKTPSK